MEKEFIPYELAVKLKDLGFDEDCLAHYIKNNQYRINKDKILLHVGKLDYDDIYKEYVLENVPLWQQAFDWFLKEHGLFSRIYIYEKSIDNKIVFDFGIKQIGKIFGLTEIGHKPLDFETYEEARQACLEKLIELCKKN